MFPVGISTNPYHAGLMFVMLLMSVAVYHFVKRLCSYLCVRYQLFTLAFGQSIAAFSGNANQAALVNPIFLGVFEAYLS